MNDALLEMESLWRTFEK